ncbi:MAG: chemotaxis protein CheA [Halocynthiibacter sp.]
MTTPDPMIELQATFYAECEELLETIEDELTALSNGDETEDTIHTLFRAVHSIKGGAGAFGHDALVSFAHHFENALDKLRNGAVSDAKSQLDIYFSAADILADLVNSAKTNKAQVAQAHIEEIQSKLDPNPTDEPEINVEFEPLAVTLPGLSIEGTVPTLSDVDIDLPRPDTTYDITFAPKNALYETGNEPLFILRALASRGTYRAKISLDNLPQFDDLQPLDSHISWSIFLSSADEKEDILQDFEFVSDLAHIQVEPPLEQIGPQEDIGANTLQVESLRAPTNGTPPVQKTPEPKGIQTIRVDITRIDHLINSVGELAIQHSILTQHLEAETRTANDPITTSLAALSQLTRDLQEMAMSIRAQPIKPLFQRMARVAREASHDAQKKVRLNTSGEDIELDKTVIERLLDPLTHMVRNAIDHGIECEEDRITRHKKPEGQLWLSAQQSADRAIIKLRDDGAGLQRNRILETAIGKGLIPADAALSDDDVNNLLFVPGFSTAASVTNLSGRGVGMDVVRKAIQNLGGAIRIESRTGEGSTFIISLPLTLAVMDGLLIQAKDGAMVIPISLVLETLTTHADMYHHMPVGGALLDYRARMIPILNISSQKDSRVYNSPPSTAIIVEDEDGQQTAVIVDDVIDQRQFVVKPLHSPWLNMKHVSAATILGDGSLALILDLPPLLSKITRPKGQAPSHTAESQYAH